MGEEHFGLLYAFYTTWAFCGFHLLATLFTVLFFSAFLLHHSFLALFSLYKRSEILVMEGIEATREFR
jgi:hypothetical protein